MVKRIGGVIHMGYISMIQSNLQRVYERIINSALNVHRNPEEIRLVVVTKRQPVESIQAVIDAGARNLGENYAEEAVTKMALIKDAAGIEWHMIGHIQSRKAKIVCEHFSLVHSLDSFKLAERLDFFAGEAGKVLPVLLEYNLSGEGSKSGWLANDEKQWDNLLPEINRIISFAHLRVQGLMTMPPLFDDPEFARPYFRKLRKLQDYLKASFPDINWNELSMGTSTDYEAAIQEGATLVRIGQAILGPRL